MKTTKRMIAVVLAAMMLALMIPFAASAVPGYTAEITAKEGYTITLYKIGEFNGTTSYTAVSGVAAGLKTAIEAQPTVSQDIYTAAEAAKKAGQNTGTVVDTQTVGATKKVTFTTTEEGLYYATVTGTPANVNVKQTGGSIFYLSSAKDASGTAMTSVAVDISSKIADGDVDVDKEILNSDMNSTQATARIGEEVTFKLSASVTGTKDEYLTKYAIKDTMSEGLTYKRVNSVKVGETTLTVNTDYTVTPSGQTVTIALTDAYLAAARAANDNGFYNAPKVYVELVCELNSNAIIGRQTNDDITDYSNTVANYNKDDLTYTNKYGDENKKDGKTVHVYTFDLDVYKVDANNEATKLAGAEFLLTGTNYSKNSDPTDGQGKTSFVGLKKGTYTLKETKAPAGYNLNNTEYTITITENGVATTSIGYDQTLKGIKVGDTPVVMPATGGQGTMMFTIIGASLIACAGVLFVILKKKRSSK